MPNPDQSSRNYRVGRGRPPLEHSFKKGQTGNPLGRKKGSKNAATIMRETLDRKIAIQVGGRLQKLTVREVIIRRIAEDAMKGNIKSASFLLTFQSQIEAGDGGDHGLSPEHLEVFKAFALRFAAKHKPEEDANE